MRDAKLLLHRLIDDLDESEAQNLLAYLEFRRDPGLMTWEDDEEAALRAAEPSPAELAELQELADLLEG